MTPFIDCFFLLMIFFLLTLQFQALRGVFENRLPQRTGNTITEPQQDWEIIRIRIKLIITRGDQPKIYLQERALYSYEELLSYLTLLPQEVVLVIEPEPKVPYKHVIGVYNTCIKAKKKNIVFSVMPT